MCDDRGAVGWGAKLAPVIAVFVCEEVL